MNVVYELLGIDNASAAVKKVETSFSGLEKSWKRLAGALAIGGSVAYLTNLVKQSLDAADSMAKLSQSTGVTVETLSGLKLAAQLSGVDINTLAGSINKMQKAMVEAQQGNRELSALFKALGVDINGGTKEALYAVADAFQRIADGKEKTAAAIAVFGKALGPQLIPFLNQGAEGIQKMEEMAAKLGLTLTTDAAKGAEQVNDTLTVMRMQLSGFGNMLMQSILPTLQGFAKVLWDGAGAGGAMDIAVQALTYTLKGLGSVGVVVFGTLKTVGTVLAAVTAAAVMAMGGDFKGAAATLKAGFEDTKKVIADTGTTLKQLWSDSLPKMDAATLKAAKALGDYAGAAKKAEDRSKEAARFAKELADAWDKFQDGYRKVGVELARGLQALLDQNNALRFEISLIGKTREEVLRLEQARVLETVAKKESLLATMRLAGEDEKHIAIIKAEIEALRERAGLMGAKYEAEVAAEQAKVRVDARNGWDQTAADIERALTDALVRGFEGGKSIAKSVGDYILGFFRTTVAQGIAKALMGAAAAGFGGMANAAGMSGLGSALGGGMGGAGGSAVGGVLGSLSGGLGIAGALGSYGATGMMFTLTGGGLGTGLGAAGSLISGGNIAGGLGMGLGTVAPYLLAAYAVYSILKGRGETRHGAQYGMRDGQVVKLEGPSGGDPAAAQSIASIGGANSAMQAAIRAFGGDAGGINISRSGWETSEKSGKRFSEIFVNGVGRRQYGFGSNEDVAKAFALDLQRATLLGLQQADLEAPFRAFFRQFDAFSMDSEQIEAMTQIASAAKSMADAFKQLGGPFEQLSSLSVAARASVLDLTGGLDQFVAKTSTYFQEFYSEQERQALSLASVAKTLGGVGLDAAGLRSTGEYRALVESLDLSTETGQRQFAALMNAAGSFAFGADLLAATGMNLGELTAGAPDNAGVDLMVRAQDQANTLLGMIERAVRETGAAIVDAVGGQRIDVEVRTDQPSSVEVRQWSYDDDRRIGEN